MMILKDFENREQGSVLVLVTMALAMLIVVIGLIIDTGILSTSKASHEHMADMTVLAAIDAYSKQSLSLSPVAKLSAAAARASEVAGLNIDVWAATGMLADGDHSQGDLNTAPMKSSRGEISGENGTLTAGFWFFEKPEACDPSSPDSPFTYDSWMVSSGSNCPCGHGGVDDGWRGSCFLPVNLTSPDAIVNGMKLELATDVGSGIVQTFSSIAKPSNPGIGVKSTAMAAMVPRHILLAVDLSPSIAAETHGDRPDPANPGRYLPEYAGQYAYQVAVSDDSGTPFAAPPAYPPIGSFTHAYDDRVIPAAATVSLEHSQATSFACLGDTWTSPLNIATDPSGATSQYCVDYYGTSAPIRRQADYVPYTLPGDDTTDGLLSGYGDTAFTQARFLIDTTTDPEPLRSVLIGVHAAMDAVKDQSSGADLLGFAGFDDDILPIRTTRDATGQPALVKPDDPEYTAILNATDYTGPTGSHLSRFLFPRAYSGQARRLGMANPHPDTQSDLYEVLVRSLQMFADAPGSEVAQSKLILFTDGMATCPERGTYTPPCSVSDFRYNVDAIRDMIQLARDEFAPKRVSINTFLIGRDSGPHTLVKGNGAGKCMTDAEMRAIGNWALWGHVDTLVRSDYYWMNNNPGGVAPGKFGGRSADAPWFVPNALYNASRYTRGKYIPIRPPCADVAGNPTNIQSQLDAACSSLGQGVFLPGGMGTGAPFENDVLDVAGNVVYNETLDVRGRLYCDPAGRSMADQVREEMLDLIKESPFVLVSEKLN